MYKYCQIYCGYCTTPPWTGWAATEEAAAVLRQSKYWAELSESQNISIFLKKAYKMLGATDLTYSYPID